MTSRPSPPPPHRARGSVILALFATTALAGVFAWITTAAARREPMRQAHPSHAGAHSSVDHEAMTAEEMDRWVQAWYAEHPMRGLGVAAGPPVATFFATGFLFNADGNLGTAIDVVQIFTGETVKWQRSDGTHTVTNGTGAADPQAGKLFDVGLNSTTPTFTYTFNTPGTYPFFCRPHEGLNMRGVVMVTDPVIGAEIEVRNFAFVRVGGPSTNAETVPIVLNQAVRWRWIEGAHTVTNGTGDADPQAGTLFDTPMSSSATEFVQVFRSLGEVPYFCRPHEGLDMRGTIRVLSPDVVGDPRVPVVARTGFVAPPRPNPSGGDIQFRFSLATGGQTRVRVLDVRGARVADILDRPLDAGEHAAGWNGLTASGAHAAPGIYFLHLEAPGYTGSERFVLAR